MTLPFWKEEFKFRALQIIKEIIVRTFHLTSLNENL